MPMPTLDPARYVVAVLADPTHSMPMPDRAGHPFPVEGRPVDRFDPFYSALLADGSLVEKGPEAAPAIAAEDATPVAPASA